MKPFEELTYLGQVRRLRRLAELALDDYGLGDAQLRSIAHAENTTFRVAVPATALVKAESGLYAENCFLLRIHRPGYQTAKSIASELAWLAALRDEVGLAVPEPVPTLHDELLTEAAAPGVPERRVCSLLRWMTGRFYRRRPRPSHFAAMGRLMAQLHNHAEGWQPPLGFTRRHWDWDGLFGDNAGFNLGGNEVWARLPRSYHEPFQAVANRVQQVMHELGEGPEAFGLIHADLHWANVLFSGGEARAIDFDDCGFGYWVYDLAVPLCECLEYADWRDLRDALIDGYAQIRLVPEKQLVHVDTFVAARHVSIALWATDLAQVNPSFRESLGQWLGRIAGQVRRFLDGCQALSNS